MEISVSTVRTLCYDRYPIGNFRANICPSVVLVTGSTERLAAFIRHKRWSLCWIRKDSDRLFDMIVGTVVLGKVGKAGSAGYEIDCHIANN